MNEKKLLMIIKLEKSSGKYKLKYLIFQYILFNLLCLIILFIKLFYLFN